jgi:hypothetical protein
MGPTLLLDKSAFQALSREEMNLVGRYFLWNRIRILFWEILGDLHKQTKIDSPRKESSILADKVNIVDSIENVDASVLCQGNLYGAEVIMDGRPIENASCHNIDGHLCGYVDEVPFCNLIHRWQRGEFTEDDALLAGIWKKDIKYLDPNGYREWLLKYHIIIPRCNSLSELHLEIENLVRNIHIQNAFLDMLMIHFGFDANTRNEIRSRVNNDRYPFQVMAPYAFYCLRVFALFLGGIVCDLTTRRMTDRIDLEYLFYLPFCNVFSSNDTFHKKLAPLLMKADQIFLSGDDLRCALKEMECFDPDREVMVGKCDPIPPMSKTSRIREIWIRTGWLY